MQLDDEETRWWCCKKDRLIFLAKEGGWIQEKSPPPTADIGLTQNPSIKSRFTGVAVNFLMPRGGVICAGNKAGLIYPVAVVALLFFAWPFAIVLVAISYIHTVAAINQKNDEIRRARSSISNEAMGSA